MMANAVKIDEMLNELDEEERNMAVSYIQFLISNKRNKDLEESRKAFAELEEFRKKAHQYFPKDFDFEKAREEAMEEKYGSFT